MKKGLLSIVLSAVLTLFISGCGGGGGTATDTLESSGDGTGQVALMLTDGPADDYDQILITIRQIELLPTDGSAPVVVFDPAEPVTYDLLNLREEDDEDGGALLAFNDVPVGSYCKIRLTVDRVVGVQATVSSEFQLSSGKIDLNPRGSFIVDSGATLAVTMDIDCDKSIHISGNHKNFRPVVFVDIQRARPGLRCPRVLQGDISALTYADDGVAVTGFEMTLPRSLIRLPILLDDTSVIIDDIGEVADAQVLAVGDTVSVRGRLQEGGLLASLVVVGDVARFDGIVTQAAADDQFAISTGDAEQTVHLTTGTLILWGCNQELDPDAIQPGMPARVIGKEQNGEIVAVAVLLRPNIITGSLTAMEAVENGHLLTVVASGDEDTGIDTTVFLPAEAAIMVKGDGYLTAQQLMAMVACAPRDVCILTGDMTLDPLQAIKVVVVPESIETVTTQVDTDQRLLTTEAGAILVAADTTILDLTLTDGGPQYTSAIDLDEIAPGDQLRIYTLSLCPDDAADYEATIVLVVPSLT